MHKNTFISNHQSRLQNGFYNDVDFLMTLINTRLKLNTPVASVHSERSRCSVLGDILKTRGSFFDCTSFLPLYYIRFSVYPIFVTAYLCDF